MNIQTVQRRIVDARHLDVGQNHITQDEVHQGPDERRDRVPQRDIKAPLLAPENRDQHLAADDGEHDPPQDVQRPFEFGGLETEVVSEQERNRSENQEAVPAGEHPPAEMFLCHGPTAEAGNEVIKHPQKRGRECAENDTVHMNRT